MIDEGESKKDKKKPDHFDARKESFSPPKNKAVYTTAPVAGGWAGAVMSWAGAEMIWAGA